MAVTGAVAAVVLMVGPVVPRPTGPVSAADVSGIDRLITVVIWNTADRLRAQDLAGLFATLDPDILVLPETTAGAVGLEPVSDPTLPVIWGVHPPPPLPGLMTTWRHEVQVSTGLAGCREPGDGARFPLATGPGSASHRGIVTAGDFNATVRHGPLADRVHCTDALDAVGSGSAGTWPASWPAWLGSPIDHVLVSGSLTPVSARLHRIGTSDHRAVSAQLRLD